MNKSKIGPVKRKAPKQEKKPDKDTLVVCNIWGAVSVLKKRLDRVDVKIAEIERALGK